MTVSTKLRLHSLMITLLVIISIAMTLLMLATTNTAQEKQRLTQEIIESSFQLISLRDEYIWYPSEDPIIQWRQQYDTLSRLLSEGTPLFRSPEQQLLLDETRQKSLESKTLFDQLVDSIEGERNKTVVEQLKDQYSMIAQQRVSNMLRLSELIRDEVRRTRHLVIIVVTAVCALILMIALWSYWISRSVGRSLRTLGKGTTIIASGNLSHQLDIRSTDEFGELATLFNSMSAQLRKSHETLEQTVEERTAQLRSKQEELRQEILNVKKFQLAVHASADAIAITLPNLTYVYVNPAWSKMTGYSPEDATDKTPLLITSDKTPTHLTDKLMSTSTVKEADKETVFQSDQFILRRKDGTEYDAEVMKYAIHEEEKPAFFVCIHRDISDRKRREQAKSEFVSLASHQLRTPLTEIRWALSNLKEQRLQQHQMSVVEAAHRASGHMAEMIESMLTIAHFETGELQAEPSALKLQTIIRDVSHLHEVLQKQKKISLTVDCPATIRVYADRKLMKQLLNCILSNALKYTPENGSVRISATEEHRRIRIDISDTGCGIPQNEQERISEKFFRGSNVAGKDDGGNGIGLSIAYALVKLLGGSISFVSRQHIGTTFTLLLPTPL